MGAVPGEDGLQVPFTEDQGAVGQLGSSGEDEAFGEAVRGLATQLGGRQRCQRSTQLGRLDRPVLSASYVAPWPRLCPASWGSSTSEVTGPSVHNTASGHLQPS
jgi:hypothetical protein